MNNVPSGTVTFLFTDIEGSTRHARESPASWETIRARHNALLQDSIQSHSGYVFQIIGDAFCVAFHTAQAGVEGAVAVQRTLQAQAWEGEPIRVRIGLHTGSAQAQAGEYRGYLTLARVQRIMSLAHGGQILLSNSTAELLREHMPPDIELRDMGEHRLKGVANLEHLWQVSAPDLPKTFPPLVSLDVIPNNLPVQVTSFVGRDQEMAKVNKLLGSTHLLTLTGPGGAGKTRLSLQVAADFCRDTAGHGLYKDGVWFVDLASLSDPTLVPQSVAMVLGIRTEAQRSAREILIDYLQTKNLLLILDNCEHLIQACAELATNLLRACPHLKILATSREALSISGETDYHVPSLQIPNTNTAVSIEVLTQYDAVKLFIERAMAVQPGFSVNNANAPAVAQICHRLDGIPLAIELAAARVRALSAEQIAARLDDRFHLLTGGSRTALSRQQTLRALIDWSYVLLSEPERVLFQRLAIFAGGWKLEAAEAVCADDSLEAFQVLDTLTHLVDKSLVQLDDQMTMMPRYRMLETIRQYAQEKLAESGEQSRVRQRHAEYYMQFAKAIEPARGDAAQHLWFHQLEREADNLRLALETVPDEQYAADCEPSVEEAVVERADLQRRIGNCWRDQYHYADALLAYRAAEATLLLHVPSPSPERRQAWCNVQLERISVLYWLNDVQGMNEAIEGLRPVVEQYGTALQRARIYQSLWTLRMRSERYVPSDETVAYTRAFVAALTRAQDLNWLRSARFQLGFTLLWHGSVDEAEQEMLQALGLAEQSHDLSLQTRCLTYLAVLYRNRDQPDLVLAYTERSLRIAAAAEMFDYIGAAHGNLAWLAWRKGDIDKVQQHADFALNVWQQLPVRYTFEWIALTPLLGAAVLRGNTALALTCTERLVHESQARLPSKVQSALERALDAANHSDLRQARTELEQSIAAARALNLL